MELKLIVDSREPEKVIKLLNKEPFTYEVRMLDIGDYILEKEDKTLSICFERKEIGDFYASIIDGRLFKQAFNMKENFNENYIMIIGNLKQLVFSGVHFQTNVYLGAIASLVSKYKINVLMLDNTAQMINLILRIGEKCDSTIDIHKTKLLQTNDEDIFKLMLSQLPMFNMKTSAKVLEKFKFKDLFTISLEQLQEIDGIGSKKAEIIKKWFN